MKNSNRKISTKDKYYDFDFKKNSEFFEQINITLAAFSIFLILFFEIINNNKFELNDLFSIILILSSLTIATFIGSVIYKTAESSKNQWISLIGAIIVSVPFLLFIVIYDDIKNNLSGLFLLIAILFGLLIIICVLNFLRRLLKNADHFYKISLLSAILMFLTYQQATLALGTVLLKTPNLAKVFMMGLFAGLIIGIIVLPIYFFISETITI